MGKVFFSVGMSLDGCIAPEGMDLEHADYPDYKDWMSRWMELHGWAFEQRFFRQNLHLGEGGETGRDNQILEETFERTGVSIMGKRMFDGGERYWPEEAPFHTPVFVLTHEVREPWERPGDTTFYFVNEGIESALKQARDVAGGKDIRIAGGADAILQYLNAGLVDEFSIELAPVVYGAGIRLFDGVDQDRVRFDIEEAIHSPMVTHLRYVVRPSEELQEERVRYDRHEPQAQFQRRQSSAAPMQDASVKAAPRVTARDIGQLENALRALLTRVLDAPGLSYQEWTILVMVSAGGPLSRAELLRRQSDSLKTPQAEVEATISALVTKGIVVEIAQAADVGSGEAPGAPAMLRLSEAGEAIYKPLQEEVSRVSDALWSDLPAEDLAATKRTLAEVTGRANARLALEGAE